MNQPLNVGIIGDFDPNLPSHIATNEALSHAARVLSVTVDCSWLPTPLLSEESSNTMLKQFDALWCSSGSQHRSMTGALLAIQFAREEGWPFIATLFLPQLSSRSEMSHPLITAYLKAAITFRAHKPESGIRMQNLPSTSTEVSVKA